LATGRDRADPVRLAPCRTIGIARAVRMGAGARAAAFVRREQRIPRQTAVASWLLCQTSGRARLHWSRCSLWAIAGARFCGSAADQRDRNPSP
jgi:hypothetical protein